MSEYDKWYKDALQNEVKSFYPNRVRLLESPGVPMFLFHIHHHAIMGEAQITRFTTKNGKYFYWFDEFLSYPHPVQLELLQTDPRLPRIAKRGRWRSVYISEATVEEIRSLGKLPEEKRKKLGAHIRAAIEELKRSPPYKRQRPPWESLIRDEVEKLKRNNKSNENALAEAQKYVSQVLRKGSSRGRSFDEVFYASLYLSFRMLKMPKLLRDIAELSGICPTRLGRQYRFLVRELNLKVPPLNPEQLIESRSGRLDISRKTIRRAISLVKEAQRRRVLPSSAPSSIAATATFIACLEEGESVQQIQVAETFRVSTVTIRNLSEKLEGL